MSLQWRGEYLFEAGDVVEVVGEKHPLAGHKGVIQTCYSSEQYGVLFSLRFGSCISLWAANLRLIESHRPSGAPITLFA